MKTENVRLSLPRPLSTNLSPLFTMTHHPRTRCPVPPAAPVRSRRRIFSAPGAARAAGFALLALAIAGAGAPAARAQQTISPANATAAAAGTDSAAGVPEKEEIVTLEEFTVTASAMSEYVAAESISGTRVAIKLRDLPFSVNVVTSEFINDFSAFEFRDQTNYTSGVVGYEVLHSGYSVRGIEANVQLRNGFRRIGLIDKVNVDRMEVIKGAAASIYGSVMPGGTVNIITKKPRAKPEQFLQIATGSDNLFRAQASSTGPLGDAKKLLYRVDMAFMKQDYDMEYQHLEQVTIAPQFLYKLGRHTTLSIEYEYLKRWDDSVPYGSKTPLAVVRQPDPWRRQPGDGIFPEQDVANYAAFFSYPDTINNPRLYNYNSAGPEARENRGSHTVEITFEHRFNRNISLRSSANWYKRDTERDNITGRDTYDPTTDSLTAGNLLSNVGGATYQTLGNGGAAWQTDLLANWQTGKIHHVTLLTLDYQRQSNQQKRYDGRSQVVDIIVNGTTYANRSVPIIFPGAREALAALPSVVKNVNGVPTQVPQLELAGAGAQWMLGEMPVVLNYSNCLGMPLSTPYHRYYHFSDHPELYQLWSYDNDNSLDIYGAYLSHRATLWENRATLFGGVRYDYLDNHARDFFRDTDLTRHNDAVSYQFGANFRIIQPITAYVNIASSFNPKFSAGIDRNGAPFDIPNETGESKEAGFKAALFGEKFVFTMAYYDIKRENVQRTAYYTNDAGQNISYDFVNGLETSKGFEFDYNWAIIPNTFQLFGQYGYIKSAMYDVKNAPGFNGGPTSRTPAHRFSNGLKYNFTHGALKGLWFTAGFRYEGKSLALWSGTTHFLYGTGVSNGVTSENPLVNRPLPDGSLPVPSEAVNAVVRDLPPGASVYLPDGRESIYNPLYRLFEIGVGYGWKTGKYKHGLQLNVRNLFNETYTYGNTAPGPARNFVLTYTLKY